MMEKREFEYYAFISYSRTDEKWAKWIQHKLETYRFPTALRKENQNLPGKIFPIFRDKTDLPSGVLWEQLKSQLEESEYLIVICSPDSARSEWVDREIAYFQELGRNRKIIPLIVDGEPHAEDSARECYNPALLNCPDGELLGVSVQELGRNMAVLRVIASLMHLRYDQLVMRDRRRIRKRRAAAVGLFTVLFIICAGIIWYEMPHSAYYWSYVYRNEVPVGLVKVSGKARKTAHDYYKIVTQRNKVIRLERVNSVGTVTNGITTFAIYELPYIEFSYSEEGKLNSVTQKTVTGEVELIKNYSQSLNAVDFQNPYDDTRFGTLPSDLSANKGFSEISSLDTSEKSEIARQLQDYDENGYLIRTLYMWDNRNTPVCDVNGIYGKQYIRDENGKILRVVNLGEDGEPLRMQYGTSVTFTDYEYDSYGRIVRCSVYDADGQPTLDERNVFCWEDIYNDAGCVMQVRCLDAKGNLKPNLEGISQYCYEYSEEGFEKVTYGLNADGTVAYDKGRGLYRIVYETDEQGRYERETYYDETGSLMINNDGYASVSQKYDEQGRVVEEWYYGLDEELICVASLSNAAGSKIEYLDKENMIIYTFYDKEGKIALNRDGFAIGKVKCNEQGFPIEYSYYDTEGKLIRTSCNAASVVYAYDNAAHLISISLFDEDGKPCSGYEGVSVISYAYDRDGNQVSKQYYDVEGNLCYVRYEGGNYAKREAEYNAYGRMKRCQYYDINGNLICVDGVYDQQCEFDERGNCIRYAFFDYRGNPMNNSDGYATLEVAYNAKGQEVSARFWDQTGSVVTGQSYRSEREYDDRGNLLHSISYTLDEEGNETHITTFYEYDEQDNLIRQHYEDREGRLHANEEGIAAYEWIRDVRGREIACMSYNENSEPDKIVEFTYDEKNRLIESAFYPVSMENGKPTFSLWMRNVYAYDDYGNQTEKWSYDGNGEIILDAHGIACTVKIYDVMGHCIREVFYDSNKQVTSCDEGYAVKEICYDAMGREIRYDFFDENGMPMTRESGCQASVSQCWNDLGYVVEIAAYDEFGKYLQDEEGVARIVYKYNSSGEKIVRLDYDAQNQPTSAYVAVMHITDIAEGGQADLAGLHENDIIIRYDDWSLVDDNYFIVTDFSELRSVVVTSRDRSRTIQVGRFGYYDSDKPPITFQEYTLAASRTDFNFQITLLDYKVAMWMLEQYELWNGQDEVTGSVQV